MKKQSRDPDQIRETLREHLQQTGYADLDDQLKEGYQARAEQNLRLAHEWFHLEEEAHRLLDEFT